MANLDIAYRRLVEQQIARPVTDNPAAVVRHLGVVQAQDYRAARWALGLRVQNASEAGIEQALSDGKVLRTHILRPTWHYVAPEDIRWMLALTGPRIEASAAGYYRQLEIGPDIFKKTGPLIEKSLQGGKHLTRAELGKIIAAAGIDVSNLLRLTYIVGHAELTGLICSGARQGNNITFALLEERVPPAPPKTREEAVIELTRRFFTGHAPATIADFVWWSGLKAADARFGLEALGSEILSEPLEGQTYYFAAKKPPVPDLSESLYLLSNFDEYVVSYKNRAAIEDLALTPDLTSRRNYLFNHVIVINGMIAGIWKRNFTPKMVNITYEPFREFSPAETAKLNEECAKFGRFVGLPVRVETGKVGV